MKQSGHQEEPPSSDCQRFNRLPQTVYWMLFQLIKEKAQDTSARWQVKLHWVVTVFEKFTLLAINLASLPLYYPREKEDYDNDNKATVRKYLPVFYAKKTNSRFILFLLLRQLDKAHNWNIKAGVKKNEPA